MRSIIRLIDSISDWTGKTARWACLLLIGVIVFEVTARYVFNQPTQWAYESATFLLCILCTLGWAYTHRHRGHIRVDVIYTHLSLRNRTIVDVVGYLIFFFPVLIMLLVASTTGALYSWSIGERGVEGFWYPPIWPIRTVVIFGAILFTLQAVAQFTRDLYLLIRNKPYD